MAKHAIEFDVYLPALESARKRAEDHPDTFVPPTADELAGVAPGDFVKLCAHGERFWGMVLTLDSGGFVVAIESPTIHGGEIAAGTLVWASPVHVFEVDPRRPVETAPEVGLRYPHPTLLGPTYSATCGGVQLLARQAVEAGDVRGAQIVGEALDWLDQLRLHWKRLRWRE